MLKITNSQFIKSASNNKEWPEASSREYCFLGRSNVGKSSFLNVLLNRKSLARVSQTPGKTRLLNFFSINEGELFFVDIPGYGFAKISKTEKAKFGAMIEEYLSTRKTLKGVFLLLDIRHLPSSDDKQMITYLQYHNIPVFLVFTKIDKLSNNQFLNMKKKILTSLSWQEEHVFTVSSAKKIGFEPILMVL